MERAAVPTSTSAAVTFTDGLGERHHILDPTGTDKLEVLCLREELAAVPSFEFALRERVSRLAGFRNPLFGRVRSVERMTDRRATLAVVSEHTPGIRLSDLLSRAAERRINLDINASLALIGQLVPAMAALHETTREMPGLAHGALGPERLVVTPDARLIVVEYTMGAALEQLRFAPERYWHELRVAVPRASGLPRFDQRIDVTQIGIVALSLILGRLLRDDEYPARIGDVVASTWAISARGGFEPLPQGLRGWLGRALQLDARSAFASASEARAELDKILGDSDHLTPSGSLEAFLAKFKAGDRPGAGAPAAASKPAPSVVAPPAAPPAQHTPTTNHDASGAAWGTGAPQAERKGARHEASATNVVRPASPPIIVHAEPASDISGAWGTKASSLDEGRSSLSDSRKAQPSVTKPAPTAAPPVTQPPAGRASSVVNPPSTGRPSSVVLPQQPPAGSSSFDSSVVLPAASPIYAPSTQAPRPPRLEDDEAFARLGGGQLEPPMFGTSESKASRPSPRLIIGAVGLVVLALAGYFASSFFSGAPAAVGSGTLVVTTSPSGAETLVDGQARGVTPLSLSLPAGSHTVEVRGVGGPRSIPVTITAGVQVSQYIELAKDAPATSTGQLQIRTEPAGARVTVDGAVRGTSPVTVADLEPGQHTVVLESDLGAVKQTVTVESGITASLVVPLGSPQTGPVSGWISVSVPIDVQIYENGQLLGTNRSDRIMVSAGRHDVDFVNDALGFRLTRTLQVPAGKVASVSLETPRGAIALNAIPWAEVWIDGERIGETPIGNYPVSIGSHDIVFRNPDLGEQHHTAVVTLKEPTRLSVDMRKR
jgi:PEGA domain-containing protein